MFHIFARVSVLDAARNVVRVVTEMYSADIRNDVVQARKRARRSLPARHTAYIAAAESALLYAASLQRLYAIHAESITR